MKNALGPNWTKATRSNNNGACVELRLLTNGDVEVRDSKNPGGPTLTFTPVEYMTFVDSIMDGELRLP